MATTWYGDGTATAVIYTGGGTIPGIELFSAKFNIPVPTPGSVSKRDWYGPSGLNWMLAPGTYWVAFEVREEDGLDGIMTYPVASPIEVAVYSSNRGPGYQSYLPPVEVGFRILSGSEIAVFRAGQWYFDNDNSGKWDGCEKDTCLGPFGGLAVDIPIVGNWLGDGKRNIGIYRQGMWYLDKNSNGIWNGCETDGCLGPFGDFDIDVPIIGDWNGDGLAKIGIYRGGMWYLDLNGNWQWDGCGIGEADGCLGIFGGLNMDIPVVGDWTGDGQVKIGIYRQGYWYLDKNGNGNWDGCAADACLGPFGGYEIDKPVVGDWNGNGVTRIGLYRQGMWYLDRNGNGNWDGCAIDACLGPFGGYSFDIPLAK